MEGQIRRWMDLFLKIPTLSPGRSWVKDSDMGDHVYRDSNPEQKFRTQRVTKHTVLVEPTEHHPAQIDKWQEDERIGKFVETVWSGLISPAEKSELIERTQTLLEATKQARQRANCQPVKQVKIAESVTNFLLKGQ